MIRSMVFRCSLWGYARAVCRKSRWQYAIVSATKAANQVMSPRLGGASRSASQHDGPARRRQAFPGTTGVERIEKIDQGLEAHPLGAALLVHGGGAHVHAAHVHETRAA